MKNVDVGLWISPLLAPYIAELQAMEEAEIRRQHEEEIATALGVPAEILFNPLVQRLIGGSIDIERMKSKL